MPGVALRLEKILAVHAQWNRATANQISDFHPAFIAKQKCMKKLSCPTESNTNRGSLLEPPAYPKTGREIFQKLKQSLDRVECDAPGELMQKQFGRLIGMPKSTTHDWYHGELAPQIRNFLCAIERLPEAARMEYLRECCRECPRLEHPRLAHDPQAVKLIEKLAVRPVGLTFVRGETDEARTFLMTAIGNSAGRLMPGQGVVGFDVHQPSSFVPVNGVLYFRASPNAALVSQVIRERWREIEKSPAPLCLFNGLWHLVPEWQTEFIKLARSRHVVLADQFLTDVELRQNDRPVSIHIVTVAKASSARILVSITMADSWPNR